MCLEYAKLYSKPIGTEDKDIACYKIYRRYGSSKNMFETVFQHDKQILGQVCKISHSMDVNVLKCVDRSHMVQENAFHSFASARSAKKFAEYILRNSTIRRKLYVVKCIIPKYSKYVYVGKFNNYKSYASEQIIPMEVINIIQKKNKYVYFNK